MRRHFHACAECLVPEDLMRPKQACAEGAGLYSEWLFSSQHPGQTKLEVPGWRSFTLWFSGRSFNPITGLRKWWQQRRTRQTSHV